MAKFEQIEMDATQRASRIIDCTILFGQIRLNYQTSSTGKLLYQAATSYPLMEIV